MKGAHSATHDAHRQSHLPPRGCSPLHGSVFHHVRPGRRSLVRLDKEGKEILLEKTIEFLGTEDVMQELVAESGLAILCGEFHTDDGLFFNDGSSLAVLLYKQCVVLGAEKTCIVHSPGEANGNITFPVRGLLILHNNKTYNLVSPHNKLSLEFVTLEFLGTFCTIPEEEVLSGHMVLQECSPNAMETHLVKHLWEQAPQKLFPNHQLFLGESPAELHGSAWVELIGAHKGLKWNALAK